MITEPHYYHAGAAPDRSDLTQVDWSYHTRMTRQAAEREARAMARHLGSKAVGVIEWWDRSAGLRPGDVTPEDNFAILADSQGQELDG